MPGVIDDMLIQKIFEILFIIISAIYVSVSPLTLNTIMNFLSVNGSNTEKAIKIRYIMGSFDVQTTTSENIPMH